MSSNLMTAATQYASRPADERFPDLTSLIQAAEYDKVHSKERTYNLRDLTAEPVIRTADGIIPLAAAGNVDPADAKVMIASPNGRADLTHYSFGQLARTIGAPAAYLRTLPADLIARNFNHGLKEAAPIGTDVNLLVRANGGAPVIRAATSDSYGRVWDADLYKEVARYFGDGARSSQGSWQSPPVWPGNPPGGQYRGDRDSFVIRIDGGSIVGDPRGWSGGASAQGGSLHRGILVRNSETGHCSISLEVILFDKICGNHILWGAVIASSFRRRHVGTNAVRSTMQEMARIARRYNDRSASQDETIIKALIQHEIASTREGVIDALRKLGATKEEATQAYDTAEQRDPSLNPRSFWGVAAGMTRASQESGHQDERLRLDQLAAAVLKLGAKQYATV